MPRSKNNLGQTQRGVPLHGVDAAAILKNIGYNKDDIQELISRGLAKVKD